MLQKAVELEVTEFLGWDLDQRHEEGLLQDASTRLRGVKITPALSRELDAHMTDSKARSGV